MSRSNRVAVIGSTSFSGSDFIDLLLADSDYEIVGISRSPENPSIMLPHLSHGGDRYQLHQLHVVHDIDRVIEALDRFEPRYVVNFAAQGEVPSSFRHPDKHFETNTLAMVRLTDALKSHTYLDKYVHISTPEVYGSCDDGAVKNDAPYNPNSPYAASKAAADMFTRILFDTYDFPVCWVRSTNVYGARQQLYRIIPRTVIYLKTGKTLTLDGGGRAVKSYIHIRDVSRGERLIMENGDPGTVYHLSPDKGISIREVVETVCRIMGYEFEDHVSIGKERTGQDAAYIIDSTPARSELGWNPAIKFEDGVRGVVDWIEANWDEICAMSHDYEFKD